MERKYHLSYDVIDCNEHFDGDYDLARTEILQTLKNYNVLRVESPCKSTIVFTHSPDNFDIVSFGKKLKSRFYFSLCLVEKNNEHIEKVHPSIEIDNKKLQDIWYELEAN